jgi:hypothetical protein
MAGNAVEAGGEAAHIGNPASEVISVARGACLTIIGEKSGAVVGNPVVEVLTRGRVEVHVAVDIAAAPCKHERRGKNHESHHRFHYL